MTTRLNEEKKDTIKGKESPSHKPLDAGPMGEQREKSELEALGKPFGSSLELKENELRGVKIERKVVEGAPLGFHHNVLAVVFSSREINCETIIDQFMSLWRGREGVECWDG